MEKYQRRNGKTTRFVDQLIQDFFQTGIAICIEHSDRENFHKNRYTVDSFLRRLKAEHGNIGYTIDYVNSTVTANHPMESFGKHFKEYALSKGGYMSATGTNEGRSAHVHSTLKDIKTFSFDGLKLDKVNLSGIIVSKEEVKNLIEFLEIVSFSLEK